MKPCCEYLFCFGRPFHFGAHLGTLQRHRGVTKAITFVEGAWKPKRPCAASCMQTFSDKREKRQPPTEEINATFVETVKIKTWDKKRCFTAGGDPTQRAHFKAKEEQPPCWRNVRAWVAFISSWTLEPIEKNSDALKCGRRVELACSFSKLGAGTYRTNNSFLESCVYFFRRGPAETIKSKRRKNQNATPGAQNVLFQFRDKLHSQGSIVKGCCSSNSK